MNKYLLAGSLAAILMMTGCSQKSTPEADMTKQPAESADSKMDEVAVVGGSGSEGFMDMDEKAMLIKELESKLQTVYFNFDQYDIRPDQSSVVEGGATVLKGEKVAPLTIKLEGNCDEWGTDEYNYALGLKRAKSVRDAMVAKGVEKDKMILVSYGESKPACESSGMAQTSANKTCWQKNRRVDFKLLP